MTPTPPEPPEHLAPSGPAQPSGAVVRALSAWVDLVCRFSWFVLLGILAVTVLLAGYAVTHLGMQTDTTAMLSSRLDWRKDSDRFDKAFPNLVRNIVIVVDSANPDAARDGAAALAKRLAEHRDIFQAIHYPPADPFFRHNGLLYLDVAELDRLSARLADAQPLLASLARDPTLRGFFDVLSSAAKAVVDGQSEPRQIAGVLDRVADTVSDIQAGRRGGLSWLALIDGKSPTPAQRRQVILAQPKPDYGALSPAKRAIALIRQLASDPAFVKRYPVSVRLTGDFPLQHDEMQSVKRSAGLAGAISLLLVGIIIFGGLRSGRLVVLTLAVLVVGLIWTAAFAAAAIGHLNIISVAFAVLFLGIGVDFGIQICLRYREVVDDGGSNDEAVRVACVSVGPALGLSALTSVIGFFAFVPTNYVGMAELGIIAGVGIVIALCLYLTLLPAVLTLTPLRRRNKATSGGALARMQHWPAKHRRTVALGCVVLSILSLAAMPWLRFEFDPIRLKNPKSESVRTYLVLASDPGTSPYAIGVRAENADKAATIAARLKALPEVRRVVTLQSFVPANQTEKLEIVDNMALFLAPAFNAAAFPAPSETENAAALARLRDRLQMLASSSQAGDAAGPAGRLAGLLEHFVDRKDRIGTLETALLDTFPRRLTELKDALSASSITAEDLPESLYRRWVGTGGGQRVAVYPAENPTNPAALRRFVNAVTDAAPHATETPVVILRAGDAVTAAFLQAGAVGAVLIILALLVILRSVADAVLVLVPVLIATLLSLAATVVFDLPFNFANVIALPLLLALGVDFGIHLVLRYREAGSVDALRRTSTPRAVLYSGLTTMASFGSLAVSAHRGTASMGYLLLISLALGLASALVVLPALLSWRESRVAAQRTD